MSEAEVVKILSISIETEDCDLTIEVDGKRLFLWESDDTGKRIAFSMEADDLPELIRALTALEKERNA